jgi:hypothetical protein
VTAEAPIGWRVWRKFAKGRPFDEEFEPKGICEPTLYATKTEAEKRKLAIIREANGPEHVTVNVSPIFPPKAVQTKRRNKSQINMLHRHGQP